MGDMMGRTPQPLKIVIVGLPTEGFRTLQDQGHTVMEMPELLDCDLVMGPNCWRLLPHLMKYLPLALKEARAAKRGKRGKA